MSEPWAKLEDRLYSLEQKTSEISASLAGINETLRFLAKSEQRVDKLENDINEAHNIIRANKVVVDMIKWAVMLIVPASLSVFVALAVDILT